ncbi:MAG: FadR/GntR family transcriptional regulator [Polyangia bacterium]
MVKPIASTRAAPPPSARRSRGESAASRLRRDILLGRYAPGDRLPPERELAKRLGTNRNTLREALRSLEAEHLLRARQGDGTIVLDWRAEGELTLLPAFLAEDTPADERFDAVLALINLRERLLSEAVALVILHGTRDDLRAIEDAIEELREARPGEASIFADHEVYRRLIFAAHSLVMTWAFNTLSQIFLELGQRFPMLWQIDPPYLDGLEQVLGHLEQKRPERAREALRHLFEDRGMALVAALRPEAILAEQKREKSRARSSRRGRG